MYVEAAELAAGLGNSLGTAEAAERSAAARRTAFVLSNLLQNVAEER
jgi:hypothetical protein